MKFQRLSFVVALFSLLLICAPTGLANGKKPPHHGNPGQPGNNDGDDGCHGGKGGKGGGNDGKGGQCGDGDTCHPKQDITVRLVRPDPAPEADATGALRVRSREDSERFEVRVEHVDLAVEHDLFIEDAHDSGTFTLVGALVVRFDELRLQLDTKHGDALPLGVAKVADLAGLHVQVRTGDVTVLTGRVPSFAECHKALTAKTVITAPEGAPNPDMYARLTLRSNSDNGRESIDLKANNIRWANGRFHVFIEEPAGSAAFRDVGELVRKRENAGRYTRNTTRGDTLPLDVASVADLANRTLEVRDLFDVVYLRGVIPAVE